MEFRQEQVPWRQPGFLRLKKKRRFRVFFVLFKAKIDGGFIWRAGWEERRGNSLKEEISKIHLSKILFWPMES